MSRGGAPVSAVFAMLDRCASGYKVRPKEHRIWILFGAKTYRGLPKGGHSERDYTVPPSTIRQIQRFFDLDPDCVEECIPQVKIPRQ